MRLLCEAVVRDFLPALRSLLAKELIKKYKLKQEEAAKRLKVSQGAISQYYKAKRGMKIKLLEKDKSIIEEIEKFAGRIAAGINDEEMSKEYNNIFKIIIQKIMKIEVKNENTYFENV